MTKTIFWNVDTQYDFMRDDESHKGALAVPGARTIEENLARLTEYARKNEISIVNTADWHTLESKEFSDNPDFVNTFPPHCLAGTKGAAYVPATEPKEPFIMDWRTFAFGTEHRWWADQQAMRNATKKRSEFIIYKDAFDVFADGTRAGGIAKDLLHDLRPDRAIVYGVATNYCVQYAVQGLLKRGVAVTVVTDAIKEIPNCDIKEFIDREWTAKGVTFSTTTGIEALLR